MDIWGIITTSVTLLVGLIAYLVYLKQKSDNKRDSAGVIQLEIKNAERVFKKAKTLDKTLVGLFSAGKTLPVESWSKNKYLFVNDFDRDEWDEITDFYNNCSLFDEAVDYYNSFFPKNESEIRVNLQRVFADYVKEFLKQNKNNLLPKSTPEIPKDLQEKIDNFYDYYMTNQKMGPKSVFYTPDKPYLDAKNCLDTANINLTLSSVGIKLKKLSKGIGLRQKIAEWVVGYKD